MALSPQAVWVGGGGGERFSARALIWIQREGMGLLIRPCLPCVTQLMMVFSVHLVRDQPLTRPSAVVRQCRQHGPSIKYKITPCWNTPTASQTAPVLGQPSSLRSHYCLNHPLCRRPIGEGRLLQSCSVRSSLVGRYTHPVSSLSIYVEADELGFMK